MSSDSDHIHQTKKRKKFITTDSENSDESIIVQTRRRKKIYRVVSEDDSSDEECNVSRPVIRRQNYKVASEDDASYRSSGSEAHRYAKYGESSDSSEWQSDWTSSEELNEELRSRRDGSKSKKQEKKLEKPAQSGSNIDSENSDEQLEKCPICLLPFKKQQLATPSSCEHCFCLECLLEWSKNINTCPVDRQIFMVIHVREELGGKILKHIPVEVTPHVEDQVQEDPTFCEVCHQSDREDRMLLCDGCDCGYHLECLTPPMNEVPMEEWYCPECSQNSQNDAEAVEIDLDEISDLMEEARRLGVSYGRTRTGLAQEAGPATPRLVPRTRQTERVRASIRNRVRDMHNDMHMREHAFDPNQPSTSSGLDSVGDNSHSRSPSNNFGNLGGSNISRSRTRSKKMKRNQRNGGTLVREVRITEYNDDGEEEEIVTYVRVAPSTTRGKCKKQKKIRKKRKRKRKARTVSSVIANTQTVKKRLALTLGMHKPIKNVPVLVPTVKNRMPVTERTKLLNARYNSGIPQVSLFGNGLHLDYSPPGSDGEDYSFDGGPVLSIQRRPAIASTRRRLALKGMPVAEPIHQANEAPSFDLLSNIMNNQETWHSSKKSNIILKADGLLLVTDSTKENNHRLNNNESPKKEKTVAILDALSKPDLDQSPVKPNENIIQAPMYNNSCGGGNRGGFRGGYRDSGRHSHGGQSYGGRDGLSGNGRHSYGGTGVNFGNRDLGPPMYYNPNFEHCGPPMFAGSPPFRGRNPQHFRNERFRFGPSFGGDGFERPPFPHAERFPRSRPPQCIPGPSANLPPPPQIQPQLNQLEESSRRFSTTSQIDVNVTRSDSEDCDIYCDIETTTKSDYELQEEHQSNGSMVLLPPPEPPSGLLDFEENSKSDKDNDSEQELVIDDSMKEEIVKETQSGDKYDPFTADSDSNESCQEKVHENPEENCDIPIPVAPPPVFPGSTGLCRLAQESEGSSTVRLTAYDDDDDEDSQSDCPNFSIYSSQTMDVARHTEQELSQQIGPLEPPPLPPSIPDDDDIIVGDVQACDLAEIPEPSNPYVEAVQKERQTLSKIPSKKISNDSRGKITFKIGNKLRINNRLSNLHEENVQSVAQEDLLHEKKIEQEECKFIEKQEGQDREEEEKKGEQVDEVDDDDEEEGEEEEEKEDEKDNDDEDENGDEDEEEEEDREGDGEGAEEEEEKCKISNGEAENVATLLCESNREAELDNTIKSPGIRSPTSDTLQSSPKKPDSHELSIECTSEDLESNDASRLALNEGEGRDRRAGLEEEELQAIELETKMKRGEDTDREMGMKTEEARAEERRYDEEDETFLVKTDEQKSPGDVEKENWESDGAYTPCKDELPVNIDDKPELESGLEPITPTKDRTNDDLDGCHTPAAYAGLGTEAISETDEAMNFEDELTLLSLRKEKEMEDGEIPEECKTSAKEGEKQKMKEEEGKKKKKKEKKAKETEKNKENISSDNQVAWKKISKSTKERPYRDKDKRSRSKEKEKEKDKEKSKKKVKEPGKKKEKRKELPRYDVRKIVAEKPSRPRKDEYGRDIREKSRSRSRSCSSSAKMSISRERGSRSYSKARSRSRSRLRIHRSWSRDRRSYSKSCRSLSKRRSLSRGRRKSSKKRSTSRRRSLSRRQSVTRRRSRSSSRKRKSLSPRRRSRRRSFSRSRERRKDKGKKYKSRSRSRNHKRSRSKSPRRASKSREKKHGKKKSGGSRSRSKGRSCSRGRNWEQMTEKSVDREQHFDRENQDSWSAPWTPSWSRSRSKTPTHIQQDQMTTRDWSPAPVLDSVAVQPKNLTVILTNKEAIKKKKKERKKESKKSKESEKRKKGKRNRTPPPSKEVFASGDNILVSVCFNKDNEGNPTGVPELPETIPLTAPIKRRRREPIQAEPPKRSKKEKIKDKRSKSPKVKKDKKKKSKAAEIAATKKPVAVIDLDQSPFREQTPSPRDVIVLSDDDDKQAPEVATPEQRPPSQTTPSHEQFVSQGPKTPPEPQIKFSIAKQSNNLRPSMLNPLLEEEEEEEEMDERAEEELEMRAQEELELRLKIGPNTPPEPPTSPPTSPDAYDPFDPTKSRSPTPDASQEVTPTDERNSPRKHEAADSGHMVDDVGQQAEQPSQEKQLEKPKIISMVTIKRPSPQRDTTPPKDGQVDIGQACGGSPKIQQGQQVVQSAANPFATINPVLATVAAAVQRSTVFNTTTPNATQRSLLQTNRISPSTQQKQRSADRPQLPNIFMNSSKSGLPQRTSKGNQGKNSTNQNGSDSNAEIVNENVDMSSPYSPGSTLSDGMFDPPSPTNFNNSPASAPVPTAVAIATANKTGLLKASKMVDKKDAFDALFGMPPVNKATGKNRAKKSGEKEKKKKSTNPKVGVRMDENQLQILDDLPSSAVEMQVKDKFLKKLNRQERVVEEVKLVLKPHYTKKHVTKEEYKDIMRKAVPKICHNKTGEINPKKIAHLIEAYVRKCRNSKKKTFGGSTSKTSKPAKNLWS